MGQVLKTKTDVLVVGAGPTGLTMTCELLRRGIRCRLIDRADTPSKTSKALAVHSRTLEVFEDMGISEPLLAQGLQLTTGNIYEGNDRLLHLNFQHLKAPYPYVLSVPQSKTESQLITLLHSLGGEVERSKQLTDIQQEDHRVIGIVNDTQEETEIVEEISADWLVGCDGSRSQVRKSLGIEFEGSTYEEDFLLADVELDWGRTRDGLHIWLHQDGPFGAIPIPGSRHWRLIVGIAGENQEVPEASVELFRRLMIERTGDTTTTISNPVWLSQFKIHRRLVENYRSGRAFLVGDAAHIHSPVGGQGMNLGIQDAYNLAWKLALVVKNNAPLALLNSYEEERRPIAKDVLSRTDTSTKLLVTQNPALQFVRDRLLTQLASLDFIQPLILKEVAQLGIHYRDRSLSQEHYASLFETKLRHDKQSEMPSFKDHFDFHAAPKAGDRAPQGYCLHYGSRTKTSLFQEFRGTHFTLLLFDGLSQTAEGYAHLVSIADWVESLLGDIVRSHIIIAGNEKPASLDGEGSILLDTEQELHQSYGARAESLYLIRPDGYIGFRSQPTLKEALLQYLNKLFLL